MKKFIFSLTIIAFMFLMIEDEIVIPDEAIRLRVIASSNSISDQNIKIKIKDTVEHKMYNLLKDTTNINEARTILSNNLEIIDEEVSNTLKVNNINETYNINFGMNFFPAKEYKGIKYNEGMYESLVVTLGKGEGDNWWCVLFPPFCLIEAEESTEVEYKWLTKELLDKYF